MNRKPPFRMALLVALAVGIIGAAWFSAGIFTSRAVQNPTISLGMDPAGNTYDDTTNTMTVGTVDNCLAVGTANPSTHTHPRHLVINTVEDLVGSQLRPNHLVTQIRLQAQKLTPTTYTTTYHR